MKKLGKIFLTLFQIIICFASLFYVFRIFLAHISEIHFYFRNFNFFYLLLSFVLLSLAFFLKGETWAYIIKNLGANLKSNNHYPIYFYPRLATYAPGGIWSFLGSIHLAKKEGLSSFKTLISFGVEFVFTLFAGVFLYLILAFFDPYSSLVIFYLCFLFFLILFLLIWPSSLTKIINFLLFLGKKEKLKEKIPLFKVIFLTLSYVFNWILLGGGLIALVRSLYSFPSNWIFSFINFNTISWIVAFVAPFVAGGLGVMEIVLFSFLKNILPLSLASFIPFGLRVLNIFSDLFVIFLVFVFQKTASSLRIDRKNFNFIKLFQRK